MSNRVFVENGGRPNRSFFEEESEQVEVIELTRRKRPQTADSPWAEGTAERDLFENRTHRLQHLPLTPPGSDGHAAPVRHQTVPGTRRARTVPPPAPGSRRLQTVPPQEGRRQPTVPPPAPAPRRRQPAGTPPPARAETESPYAEYEQLGLITPEPKRQSRLSPAKLVVSVYRLVGFFILTVVVALLVAYIGTSIFYFVNKTWVEPMVVAPTDERVLQLKGKMAEHASVRDDLVAQLNHTERFIVLEEAFQSAYDKALTTDLADRKATLNRLRSLADDYAGTRTQIKRSNQAFAEHSRDKLQREYEARLISRDEYMARSQRLADLANANLSLAERQAEFDARAEALAREAKSLGGAMTKSKGGSVSYEVLRIKQEYERSRLETAKAAEKVVALRASIERHEAILADIQQSPYLRAANGTATVAFVPYDNIANASPGTTLYGCAVEMVVCKPVGKVVEVFPGEITYKHPHREKQMRGQLMQIELDEVGAAEKNVLFAGKPPLYF